MNRRVGVITEAWKNVQNKEVQPLGLYWENMEVVYKLLRFMGYLPYRLNKAHNKIETSFESKLWAIIACIVFVTFVLLEDKKRLYTPEYWNSYSQVLESLIRLMFTNTVVFYVSTWWDLSKLVIYINEWSKLSSDLTLISNTFTKSNSYLTLKMYLIILACLIMTAAIVDQIIFLGYIEPLRLFAYFTTVYFSIVFTTFWVANCIFITQMARILRKSLITTIKGRPNSELMRSYCFLWLQLQKKTQELNEALKVSLALHLLLNHISLIFTTYVWMSTLVYRPEISRVIAYTSPMLITTITLIFICESSNSVTDELGYKYTEELLSVKPHHTHVAQEVDLLLETIQVNPAEIKLGGCITLNRKLIVTLISTTITYIVVLLQFDVSSH